MILSQDLNDAFCEQIAKEYQNMLLYKKIAIYFEELELTNIAKYFHNQAEDENSHANQIINHLNDRVGGKVRLDEVPSPEPFLVSVDNVGDLYLSLEQETTESIESIYDLAFSQKSFIDIPFLSDFLKEQIEEESSATSFMKRIKMVKDLVLFDATFGD